MNNRDYGDIYDIYLVLFNLPLYNEELEMLKWINLD